MEYSAIAVLPDQPQAYSLRHRLHPIDGTEPRLGVKQVALRRVFGDSKNLRYFPFRFTGCGPFEALGFARRQMGKSGVFRGEQLESPTDGVGGNQCQCAAIFGIGIKLFTAK